MKEYHCLDLKFKDSLVSELKHHAHLYVKNDLIFIRIFIDENNQNINRKFMHSQNSLGFFDENFEFAGTENKIILDKSQILQIGSHEFKGGQHFFTIYLSNVLIIKKK